ncbi:MAG: LysR family glycine cleavage system transcriptional activator [Candidatus Endobugula sp.]|jgi:LysR family glycine cleavage system transcriptional activator
MKRHLPPLNALRVFEVAAKSASFSHTAEILCVTQSAISKQIRILEEHIGIALFERRGGTVTLTHEGKAYLSVVSQALDIIEAGSEKFYHPQQKEMLTINIMPSLSTLWMFSRVDNFHRAHPNIMLRIDSADDDVDWYRNPMDIAVRCMPTHKKPKHAELLFTETLQLIASPLLIKNVSVKTINDLQDYEKINLKHRPNLWDEFFAQPSDTYTAANHFGCEHFYMVIQAALENLGIGLAPDFLCADFLREGRLVNPLNISTKTEYGYYLITPPHKKDQAKVIQFSQWLKDAFKPQS